MIRNLPKLLILVLGCSGSPASPEPVDRDEEAPAAERTTRCPEGMALVDFAPVCMDRFEARVLDGRALSQQGQTPTDTISWNDALAACEAVVVSERLKDS